MSKFTQIKTVLKTENDGKKMKKVELQFAKKSLKIL